MIDNVSVVALIAGTNYFTVNRTLAKLFGLDAAALIGELASECLFWQENGGITEDGYFYSTVENVQERTTLSEYKQRLALDTLRKRGLVEVTLKGLPAKRHIKFNEERFIDILQNSFLNNCGMSSLKIKELDVRNFRPKNNNIRINNKDNLIFSNEKICGTGEPRDNKSAPKSDYQKVIEAWNGIGVNPIKALNEGTTRYVQIKKRIAQYGLQEVLSAIQNIPSSDFLMGRTKEGFNLTFDWFCKPNNFIKVYEGNYNDRAKRKYSKEENAYRSAEFLANAISTRFPNLKPISENTLQVWAGKFADFVVGGIDWSEMMWALKFSQEDSFWQKVVLDPDSFTKNYLKIISAKEEAESGNR